MQDISIISKHWANAKPYKDNPQNYFGVTHTGLPAGCQIEQVQVLHRHASRNPSSSESALLGQFAARILKKKPTEVFHGPLSFLNTWTPRLGVDTLLATGVSMGHTSGTNFWTKYGRLLYNANPGQTSYNSTNQKKPLLRCNMLPRVFDTANAWADGFFGQYGATEKYSLLPIPYVIGQNNTLASYASCLNFLLPTSILGRVAPSPITGVPIYLANAAIRLSQYAPPAVNFSALDVRAMQQLCVYEYAALGSSDFCKLFTLREWKIAEYLMDSYIYNYISFGSPAGRAIGLGILQEMLARLQGVPIASSDSSVNSTLDSSSITFPLDQKFYIDFSHDFIIAATLAAMSLDYFRQPLPPTYPPPPHRHFKTSNLVPYAARLVIEKIGCNSAHPTARKKTVTQYSDSQYGYSPSTATNKFVRIRLNEGILPLRTIRGDKCKIAGRTDGLCPLKNFLDSQANATESANYQFTCFGNYTYNSSYFYGDGNYFPSV